MTVSVRIPTILRSYTGGTAVVTGAPGTVREVIAGLDADYPGIGGRLLDDAGQLRRFVNVYVGEEDVAAGPGPRYRRCRRGPDLGDPGGRGRLTARHVRTTAPASL